VLPVEYQQLLDGSLVPCSWCSRTQGRLSTSSTGGVLGEMLLLPSSPTLLSSSIFCAVLVHVVTSGGDDRFRAETPKLSTSKEISPHRGSKRHAVCLSFRERNYSSVSFISLSHACTDSSTAPLRTSQTQISAEAFRPSPCVHCLANLPSIQL